MVERIDGALTAIDGSAPACVDSDIVRDELRTAARLARHGALRLLGAAERADLQEAIAEQERCWLARSRPGGLADSLAHLHRSLADYPYDNQP